MLMVQFRIRKNSSIIVTYYLLIMAPKRLLGSDAIDNGNANRRIVSTFSSPVSQPALTCLRLCILNFMFDQTPKPRGVFV